jgi:hypothetical protein
MKPYSPMATTTDFESVDEGSNPSGVANQPELYLIAHKVRDEPAFDIAIQIEIGEEDGWIIPTSGHRAYPWWWVELTNIDDQYELEFKDHTFWIDASRGIKGKMNGPGSMPPDLRDHYTISPSKEPKHNAKSGQSLLTQLGFDLIPKSHPAVSGTLKRRI